jgi:DNA-binding transcriptional LysR family regulator
MTPPRPARAVRAPELDELRTLCAAADLGSLGRAALRLHVSQPAVTKRLQALEALAGVRLLERSSRGVKLTPAGRRLYDEAHRLLEQSDRVEEVLAGLKRSGGPVRLAASHSATEAFVGDVLARLGEGRPLAVELITANSSVVRDLVADGRADVGVAASRPQHTPYPGVTERSLAPDAIVCAIPRAHAWARLRRVTLREFLATPMVRRDPSSNARWTVEAVLRERGLTAAPPLVEVGTPQAAMREAEARCAPVLLSRHVVARDSGFVTVEVPGLAFPRQFVVVVPGTGEPTGSVAALIERLVAHVAAWSADDQ